MRIEKVCKICGTKFIAIKSNQYYDKRACFKRAYNISKREERRIDRETNPARFGWLVCSHCGLKSPLPYSPKRYKIKFESYSCPGCGTPRFKDTKDMFVDWDDDIARFGQGWKTKDLSHYKDVVISMTFQTFLSGGTGGPPSDQLT